MIAEAKFWDKSAKKYAQSPIKNIPAYEATLARVRTYLGSDDNVLEFGCGTGMTALKLSDRVAHYTGSDISPAMIDVARGRAKEAKAANVDFTVAQVIETRFEPGSFDAVLGFNILHLLEDLPRAIARSHELLKPGGLLITKTPCLGQMTWLLKILLPVLQFIGKAPFVASFNAEELEGTIRAAGFQIIDSRVFDGGPNNQFIVARKV